MWMVAVWFSGSKWIRIPSIDVDVFWVIGDDVLFLWSCVRMWFCAFVYFGYFIVDLCYSGRKILYWSRHPFGYRVIETVCDHNNIEGMKRLWGGQQRRATLISYQSLWPWFSRYQSLGSFTAPTFMIFCFWSDIGKKCTFNQPDAVIQIWSWHSFRCICVGMLWENFGCCTIISKTSSWRWRFNWMRFMSILSSQQCHLFIF